MTLLPAIGHRITGALDRTAAALNPALAAVDRAALMAVGAAFSMAAAVFWLVPADAGRLSRFTAEHVTIFGMVDSTPQRLAFMAALGVLLAGAAALRLSGPSRLEVFPPAGKVWPQRLLAIAVLTALVISFTSLGRLSRFTNIWVLTAIIPYLAAAAVFVWNRRLPVWLAGAATVAIVLIAWLPATTGLLLRIGPKELVWVDQHMAGVFSSADMLASGYRLFADVPVNYGLAVQIALAAALKSGHGVDLAGLIHVTEAFQAAALCLFALAAWVYARDAGMRGRSAAVLLVILVAAPFLATANPSVLFTNQSGLRFVMLPAAALTAVALERWRLVPASALAGAVTALALLHNAETGIAILAGLGLGWLMRARTAGATGIVAGVLAGAAAAAALLGLAAFLHFAVFGYWPVIGGGNPIGLVQSFAAGYAGMQFQGRLIALILLTHAGYIAVRALAGLMGRGGARPDAASAAIAGMLIAWAPYYVNRPDNWNLWSFLALYSVLLAPAIAKAHARSACLAVAAILLLAPIPATGVRNDAEQMRKTARMETELGCAAGLSLPPALCTEHLARAAELRQIAAAGDAVWLTAYPFLTLRLTHLKPLIPALDAFSAARTEASLNSIAEQIKASSPTVLVLDAPDAPVPVPMRLLLARIADRAGFSPCQLVPLSHWQAWLPKGTCQEGGERVAALRAR